jgi:site-specific recombinase XerD
MCSEPVPFFAANDPPDAQPHRGPREGRWTGDGSSWNPGRTALDRVDRSGWAERFISSCGGSDVKSVGEREIKAFLTHLAVEENVAPKTQGQAKSALLFLFQEVLGRELAFLDVIRSTKAERLPVVLSRREIELVFPEFQGLRRLMFLVMYGAGLRHRERL